LNTLLHNPNAGMYALRARLSQIDRETLVKLLAQRPDLSEDQVNRTIDNVQTAIRRMARSPRRLATRTQQQIISFESALEDYLRNTHKSELSPEGIKRDLLWLFKDPKIGVSNLVERISQIDRETLISLLSQRKDMTEAEAARVVDQVLSVRDQFMGQIHAIQDRIQSVIDGILGRIRDYLNGLERPELNYESIRDDVRTMFYDPKAGFDAIRDRLSHFNRDTLVALLASRNDISEAQANRIIDQVEHARNTVLRRAERIQEEAQRRVEEVRRQAKKQAIETRKAAETAAWWLFGTAIVSAGASAIAGAIAVIR
jgi:nucleoid DNA-binding protein